MYICLYTWADDDREDNTHSLFVFMYVNACVHVQIHTVFLSHTHLHTQKREHRKVVEKDDMLGGEGEWARARKRGGEREKGGGTRVWKMERARKMYGGLEGTHWKERDG